MVIEPYLDLTNAKRHREQDRNLTNAFYDQQTMEVAQWGLGKAKPPSVRVGELPTVCLPPPKLDSLTPFMV